MSESAASVLPDLDRSERSGRVVDGWHIYREGEAVRCPGPRGIGVCLTARGVVMAHRQIRIRVKQDRIDPRTDRLELCHRCKSELEISVVRLQGAR